MQRTFILTAISALILAASAQERPLPSLRLHLTEGAISIPTIRIDIEGEADAATRAWAEEASAVVRQWWPQVTPLLATEEFRTPEHLTLFFKKELKPGVPAYRTPEGLFISIAWITKRPDDFGMIVHEMTHAIQDYRRTPRGAGWLVEGIADYIRYWHYEPEAPRPRFDAASASYRDGYGTTGAFLAWLIHRYDRRIVRLLDAGLRRGDYEDSHFVKHTGKPLDTLWAEFLSQRR